jgi:hypothetical protein
MAQEPPGPTPSWGGDRHGTSATFAGAGMSEERIGADAEPRALAASEPASTRASRQPPKSGDRTTTADTERIVRIKTCFP